jgi:H+/Cl- antiporter ClcA
MGLGASPGEPDDDGDSITSGSPKNLLVVAIVAALLTLAGVVFYIAWQLEDLSSASEKWRLAYSILSFTATGIFCILGLWSVWALLRQRDQKMFPDVLLRSRVFSPRLAQRSSFWA